MWCQDGLIAKMKKKKYESKGMSLNGDGLNNITFCPLKAPPPLPTSSFSNIVTGTLYAPHSSEDIFLFWILLFPSISYRHPECLSLFSSSVFASVCFSLTSSTFAVPVWLAYIKIRLPSASLWAMYENQPTLFNTCLRGRISVHVGGAVGVGYGFRVVEGVDRQRWQLQRLH